MSAFSHALMFGLAVTLGGLGSIAAADPLPVTHTRRHIDRFAGTWSLGATIGAGAPLGVAGAFLELRPVRALSFDAGVGFGGAFGPAVGGTAFLSPFSTRAWSPQIGVSFSHQFSYIRGEIIPGRAALPATTNWVGVEVASEFRPSRSVMLRIGVGRAFLLNTSEFAIASQSEIANVPQDPLPLPGATPYDAVTAASTGSTLGIWYVHIDIAPTWRF